MINAPSPNLYYKISWPLYEDSFLYLPSIDPAFSFKSWICLSAFLKKSESNLSKESVVNVSQIITIDKSFLSDCVGTVSDKLLKKNRFRNKISIELIIHTWLYVNKW